MPAKTQKIKEEEGEGIEKVKAPSFVSEVQEKTPEQTEETKKTQDISPESTAPQITSFSQLDTSTPDSTESEAPTQKEAVKPVESEPTEPEIEEQEPEEKLKKEKPKISSEEIKEWLSEVRPDTTKEVEKGRKPLFKILMITVFVLLILGIIVGGIIYYQSSFKEKPAPPEEKQQEELPSPSPEPTGETQPELDLTEYKLRVLNGSGIAGEAGKVNTKLKGVGFEDTETGNADSYDYTTTIVSLKEDVPNEVYEKIKEALSDEYILEKSETALEENASYDVEIIVGSQKASD